MGVDLVGVDFVNVDLVGGHHTLLRNGSQDMPLISHVHVNNGALLCTCRTSILVTALHSNWCYAGHIRGEPDLALC